MNRRGQQRGKSMHKRGAVRSIARRLGAAARPPKPYGVAVEIVLEHRGGPGRRTVRRQRIEKFFRRPAERPIGRILDLATDDAIARRLAGLGHRKRVAIVKAILGGADTHKDLSRRVTIKTGPLYFHLRALERQGLIRMEERGRYQVTAACRDFMLIVVTAMTRWTARKRVK